MIEVLEGGSGNVLAVQAVGKLTDQDYKSVLIPKIESLLTQHPKVRVLFSMGEEFHGWDLGAAWDDATFGFRHRNDFDKCAVVGGPRWVEWATKFGALLMNGEVRTFSSSEMDQAWSWIRS